MAEFPTEGRKGRPPPSSATTPPEPSKGYPLVAAALPGACESSSRSWTWQKLFVGCSSRFTDVGPFATELSGQPWNLADTATALYLAMVFGWNGAPVECVIWATGMKACHEGLSPQPGRMER